MKHKVCMLDVFLMGWLLNQSPVDSATITYTCDAQHRLVQAICSALEKGVEERACF